MRPDLIRLPFDIPIVGNSVKGYGFMLMVGFLTCIYWVARRTLRAKGDPDIVLNAGFIALIAGVLGARIFFVAHYWEEKFAHLPNRLWAVLDMTSGGLEFYGGFLLAMFCVVGFFRYKGVSLRMYVDMVAPSMMFALACARVGCFLNGCCWGGVCIVGQSHEARLPWAMRFPFGSPAQYRHWENMEQTVPAELLFVGSQGKYAYPLSREILQYTAAQIEGPTQAAAEAQRAYEQAKAENQPLAKQNDLFKASEKAQKAAQAHRNRVFTILASEKDFGKPAGELLAMANDFTHRSLPVHPAQLYGMVNALLLCLFLTLLLRVRQRHGIVFATMLMLYPISRFVLEVIRGDNPHDIGGLTISQSVSIGMFSFALVLMIVIYRLPLRSPRAVPVEFELPIEDDTPKGKKKKK
jgi:phosphatidylglycerol:prolipoprotein diacylglycerol transferase